MSNITAEAEIWAKEKLGGDSSGHDWWHIERVRRLALRLAAATGANAFVCEMAALLHDLADEKLFGDEESCLRDIRSWLAERNVAESDAEHIVDIIANLGFKGGGRSGLTTLEGRVVQDADRLDALGAVGIARTFAYSGWKGQPMHDPSLPIRTSMTAEEYRTGKSSAYNHFHEKLLKLKELLNTDEARRIAEDRHRYMESFLRRFEAEWNGTDAW
ncbi:HD domain-containing protein [Paenibacillus antri]|uniref:HD domain-containing protein n=1 Tax=Paenibacillus antri TaxID=2582848 RepID=A0A5R9GBP6_9BACL|nr:HD domain-containing protein [Paenibacillus antri]TLS50143.1 HD domain-containing protein [Paenibacillus antri]